MGAPAGMPLERLNPLHYMGAQEYNSVWQKLFATVLYGFWGRMFFVALMIMAFYVGVRQRNPALAGICLVLAAVIAYGGGVWSMVRAISFGG